MSAAANEEALLLISQQVLASAHMAGADAAEVAITAARGHGVTARNGDVETVERSNDHDLTVTVYANSRKGSSSVSGFSTASIEKAVTAALAIAKYTSADACTGLCDADLLATDFPDLQLDHAWDIDAQQAIDIAIECESAIYDQQDIVNTDGTSVATERNIICYANSHGFARAYPLTHHSITAVAIAGKNGELQRDYWYSANRNFTKLEDHVRVGRRAGERAARRLGARRPQTGKAAVIFEAPVAAGLFGAFIGAISGSALYSKTSFLCTALHTGIFPAAMQIAEQPHLPGAVGSAAFDNEGVATRPNKIVCDGILNNYVLNSYAARRLGMQTTGNAGGVHNLIFAAEKHDIDTLLRTMDRGLLVTEIIGPGINIVTGDYSRGAAGFWVENGVIQYPVEEVTIAGNLRSMFQQIVMMGDDVDERGNIRSGSVLIEEMTLATA